MIILHWLIHHWQLTTLLVGIVGNPIVIHRMRYEVVGNRRKIIYTLDVPAAPVQSFDTKLKKIEHAKATTTDGTAIGAYVTVGSLLGFATTGNLAKTGVVAQVIGI